MNQDAPLPPEPAQDAAIAAPEPVTEKALHQQAGQLAVIDYSLFRSHPLRMETCRGEVAHMLQDRQEVTARFEPVTNFFGMVKHKEDGTPQMALVLHDPTTDLKLILNPHDDNRPLRLSQMKESPAEPELPSGTPEIYTSINALARSGQSLTEIMADNPEAATAIDGVIRATVKTAKASDDDSLTNQVFSGGMAIAQIVGARVSKSASMVFGAIDAIQSLRDNRPAQAAIDVVNSLPGVGFALSEVLQLIGNKMGLDVEPSLLQRVGDGIEVLNSIGPTGEFNGLAACGDKVRPTPTMTAESDQKINTTELALTRNTLISPDSQLSQGSETAPTPAPRASLQTILTLR